MKDECVCLRMLVMKKCELRVKVRKKWYRDESKRFGGKDPKEKGLKASRCGLDLLLADERI